MSSGTTAVTIDFGTSIAPSATLGTTPTLPALASQTSSGEVNVGFTWTDNTNGEWKKLFSFKTDSTDLTDISNNTDILMEVNDSQFYSANFISSESVALSPGTDTSAPIDDIDESIAKEYVRHLAKEIFGRTATADLFQNEEALVSDIEGSHGASVLADIKTALKPQNYAYLQSNANPAWLVLSALLNVDSGTRFDEAGINLVDDSSNTGYKHMPLKAGDKLVFTVKFNEVTAATHGIGENDVPARTYKITITLADP
jgi:hypothetical protein